MIKSVLPADLTAYELPPGDIFPSTAPRYPNLWMLIHDSLAADYRQATALAMRLLEHCTDMYNDFGYTHTAEGCDAFARRRGLQPVRLGVEDSLSHDHCVHLRFYTAPLRRENPVIIEGERFFQVASSLHYEVDRPQKLHPYVDECPYCGCTGEYSSYMGSTIQEKDRRVHDPLGLELVLYGTIRGERIVAFDGLNSLENRYAVNIHEIRPTRIDITTEKVGIVLLSSLNE